MKRCPSCSAENPDVNKFCQHCGKPLPAFDATVQMTETVIRRNKPGRQSFDVQALFGGRERLVVGRAADCDIRLDHPSVSRYHARLERQNGAILVSDLSSVNGVWVGGQRVVETARLKEGDKVGIGPYILSLSAGMLQSLDSSRSLRLEARHLERVVPTPSGPRKLLDDISLVVNPGEFVALLGPSGSGKSTLMDCLNGRRRATGGLVLANGENFYRHFDSFRQSLGYVPQKDIVHTDLTVEKALLYTARLRLPMDSAPEEISARLEDVLRKMGLDAHRHTRVDSLSGGQIKRVSLGAELLGQPALLYIDEATSGLDAGTERRMMHLFRDLADEGRSLMCITHNVENVDRCHLILVLAQGKLVYLGPPTDAPRWFKVPRISDIYGRIAEREVVEWEADFRKSDLYQEFVASRLAPQSAPGTSPSMPALEVPPQAPAPPAPAPAAPEQPKPAGGLSGLMAGLPMLADQFRTLGEAALRLRERFRPLLEIWHQFRVLTERYIDLIIGDWRNLQLMLIQSPLVALILLLGFVGKPFDAPMPILRPLKDQERRALKVIRAMGGVFGEGKLTKEQEEALRRVKVSVAGMPGEVNGTGIVRTLRKMQAGKLSESEKQALKATTIKVPAEDGVITVSADELASAWRDFQADDLAGQILRVEGPAVPERPWKDPRYTYTLLFMLSVVMLWFGCNNACREIVKEEAIYARERAVNLRVGPYLASKFVVLTVITTLQVGLLMLFVYGPLEALAAWRPGHTAPPEQLMLSYGRQFLVFAVLGMTGVAMGLLLSAVVTSADRANALLPYVLIPQMILGGGLISITGLLFWVAAFFCPAYWAYRAVRLGADVLPLGFPGHAADTGGISWPCMALLAQTAVLLGMTYVALRRKEA